MRRASEGPIIVNLKEYDQMTNSANTVRNVVSQVSLPRIGRLGDSDAAGM